jgi:hypothetical protein
MGYTGDYYNNAGNYGYTSPVTLKRRNLDSFDAPRQRYGGDSVAIPQDDPGERYNEPRWYDSTVPSVEQLLQQPRTPSEPGVMPTVPPTTKPRVPAPTLDSSPIDTIPFTPSDGVAVPQTEPCPMGGDMEVPITLEELRRIDPSVQKVEILSIEDAGVASPVRQVR